MGKESSAGFAIGTYGQDLIEENAKERFSTRYGDLDARKKALRAGLITPDAEITEKGWALLNKDVARLEKNALEWLGKVFDTVRDEGHGSDDDLVGTFWFDPIKLQHAAPIYLASDWGASERIDMTDASYGSLAKTAFRGVSDFGAQILGGQINFFDVNAGDQELIEATLERQRARAKARRR